MRKTIKKTLVTAVAAAGMFSGVAAFAVDGVVEINAASVAAGNITPGDAPGFPATISEPGSYRLTSNLEVPNANTHGIEVTSSYVTIDLNGFVMSGPDLAGTGNGITASSTRQLVAVRNGVVWGMGNGGIRLAGARGRVENVRAYDNGDDGIQLGLYGYVKDCMANFNGDTGILVSSFGSLISNHAGQNGGTTGTGGGFFVGQGGLARGNTASNNAGEGMTSDRGTTIVDNTFYQNGEDGLRATQGCVVKNNTARDNTLFGLNLGTASGYANNVLTGNGSGSVTGGIQIGTNVCGANTTCP